MSVNEILGDAGIGYSAGGAAYTPPGGKKVFAIGVVAAANVTSLKYTPPKSGNSVMSQVQVTDLEWFGASLPASAPTAFIPLGFDADEVVYASGTLIFYLR